MYTHYAGTEFYVLGLIQRGGGTFDGTGATLSATLFDSTGTTIVSSLAVTWVDAVTGLVQIILADTSAWPAGKLRIQPKLTAVDGTVYYGRPLFFRVVKAPS